jgi:hypothetical protein
MTVRRPLCGSLTHPLWLLCHPKEQRASSSSSKQAQKSAAAVKPNLLRNLIAKGERAVFEYNTGLAESHWRSVPRLPALEWIFPHRSSVIDGHQHEDAFGSGDHRLAPKPIDDSADALLFLRPVREGRIREQECFCQGVQTTVQCPRSPRNGATANTGCEHWVVALSLCLCARSGVLLGSIRFLASVGLAPMDIATEIGRVEIARGQNCATLGAVKPRWERLDICLGDRIEGTMFSAWRVGAVGAVRAVG